jgi:MFS family permease
MSKALDVVTAGIVAGIVAYATAILGIGGTVIGAVLGAILYQVMSHLFKEPLEKIETQNFEAKIVYVIPLVLIVIVEISHILAMKYFNPDSIFYQLEAATKYNLFRSIGAGLIIMGLYPIIQSEYIKKSYGYIILVVGVIVLLGGFADFNTPITDLYSVIYSEMGIIIPVIVIAAISYVAIAITWEAVDIYKEKKNFNVEKQNVKYGERIDDWLDGNHPKAKSAKKHDKNDDGGP